MGCENLRDSYSVSLDVQPFVEIPRGTYSATDRDLGVLVEGQVQQLLRRRRSPELVCGRTHRGLKDTERSTGDPESKEGAPLLSDVKTLVDEYGILAKESDNNIDSIVCTEGVNVLHLGLECENLRVGVHRCVRVYVNVCMYACSCVCMGVCPVG